VLEIEAIRELLHYQEQPIAAIPHTASRLVGDWAARYPLRLAALFARNPLTAVAFRRLRKSRDWSAGNSPPRRIVAYSLPEESSKPSLPGRGVLSGAAAAGKG
jgi:hypothetical protein